MSYFSITRSLHSITIASMIGKYKLKIEMGLQRVSICEYDNMKLNFLTSCRTFWRHDVFLTNLLVSLCIFDVMTYFWRHDVFLTSWRTFWLHDEHFDVMTNFLTSCHIFDLMTNFLTLWHIFHVMTNLLTSWVTF